MPSVSTRQIEKILTGQGWRVTRNKSGHLKFRKPGNPYVIAVSIAKKDFPIGTLRRIERLSGVKIA